MKGRTQNTRSEGRDRGPAGQAAPPEAPLRREAKMTPPLPSIRISDHAAQRYAERAMGVPDISPGYLEAVKDAIIERHGDQLRLAVAMLKNGGGANVRVEGLTLCLQPDASGHGYSVTTVLPRLGQGYSRGNRARNMRGKQA